MNIYLIEPLAPLVFRSGKPFSGQSGADGANFPLPSSMAGMLRTVTADQNNQPFSDSLKEKLRKQKLKMKTAKILSILE